MAYKDTIDNGNNTATLNFDDTLNSVDFMANSNGCVDFSIFPNACVAVHTSIVCTNICSVSMAKGTPHDCDAQPWYAFMGHELDVLRFKYHPQMV